MDFNLTKGVQDEIRILIKGKASDKFTSFEADLACLV